MLSLTAALSLVTLGLVGATSIEPASPVAWQPMTLTFAGPEATETHTSPNPFLDLRLQVIFTGPAGQRFNVPGFFDADGRGGPRGHDWRVRFAAPVGGRWRYDASL